MCFFFSWFSAVRRILTIYHYSIFFRFLLKKKTLVHQSIYRSYHYSLLYPSNFEIYLNIGSFCLPTHRLDAHNLMPFNNNTCLIAYFWLTQFSKCLDSLIQLLLLYSLMTLIFSFTPHSYF